MSRVEPSLPLAARAPAAEPGLGRAYARGKFLFAGDTKFWVRGVTYGTFRAAPSGDEFPDPARVTDDFAQMAASGVNAVRTYTVPPRWLLDAAAGQRLRVLVGVPWEEHVAFLEDRRRARSIEARVRAEVRACAGHPAVLGYAVANEIPAPIVRWHGAPAIERFIDRLVQAAREEDPAALVTYVNYPTTEYLALPSLDLVCFNVYLESPDRLAAYLARLHNLAGDRPLILSEVGLDSRRHGEIGQARALDWQVRTIFAAGGAGAFVFSWTDEWHRGGWDVEDWDFGLTDRERRPKPALTAVRKAFAEVPFAKDHRWPRISVVLCSYNGARTIRECLDGLLALEYPNFEVIVVDDGSTDATAAIAAEYPFRLIRTPNRGLSSARNTGMRTASGDILAYIDDDAIPDPHWLTYLAAAFLGSDHAGVGGPNIPPAGDGFVADCVAQAPGGPIHVLLSDKKAEHIPGCNMAFRKAALEAIGGFDARFRTAGDDVDLCWRLQERGWTLGFTGAAMVWHHRRKTVRAYWRQQVGYGRAEALLERKWPERYNAAGHTAWAGRVYGPSGIGLWGRGRIYHGTWGSALFQSIYQPAPGLLACLVAMPEWWLTVLLLGGVTAVGLLWKPLLWTLPLFALAAAAPIVQSCLAAARTSPSDHRRTAISRIATRGLIALLHLLQPLARLRGRMALGLTPWRRRGGGGLVLPWPWSFTAWSERWRAPAERLSALEAALRARGFVVLRGGHFDRWDLEVRGGVLGAARLLMATEEHGAGRQLVRFRVWPHLSALTAGSVAGLVGIASIAAGDGAWLVAAVLAGVGLGLGTLVVRACGAAASAFLAARPAAEASRAAVVNKETAA